MEKIKLSPWEILTLVVFSILLNQLVSSYEAYTLVYITNAIFLTLIFSKLIKKTSNQSKQKNELTLVLAKLGKLNEKTFEKFIIALLKKYAFHSINKFDVKDDSDNISDSYLLAQRDGVFYEIRTFATRKELSEKHVNRITNKFRDSPTQIDNRILFINCVATDQVKNLIDNSGITLNTIDAVKIRDLIHVVEPREAVPATGFKVNLAHSIDNMTNMLNALKLKLVGMEPVNLSNKSIEQALNETIITEGNNRSVAEETEPTTITDDNITGNEQNPEPTTVASNDNSTEVHEDAVNTSSVNEVTNNDEITSEQDQVESNTKDESQNTVTGTESKDQPVETSEDAQPSTNTDDDSDDDTSEEDTVISEDELNEIDIGTTEDFNFESSITTSVSPAIDMSELDEFATESGNSDDDLLGGGNDSTNDDDLLGGGNDSTNDDDLLGGGDIQAADDDLLNPTQPNQSETENTTHEDTDNTESNENAVAQDVNSNDDSPLNSDNTTIGPTETIETQQSTNDETTDSVKVVDQIPDQDDELALMLAAQESSLSINNCENFDNEGNTTLTQIPTEFTLDYSEADILQAPTEMTQDDILAMSLIAEQDEIENEISSINTETVVKIKIEQEAQNKDENFQTASDDDLLLGSTNDHLNISEKPSVVETEKPKRKRPRGKNKT
ncbi:hypothetical protein HCY52_08305 [Acinetobacter radioresistens]|uniref:hypothetical protein n=1 Tax=Acinetobacter radioresistens TaxID=40216 RepID=UPI0020052755|nr:hypothetical protein [Acinetobacter radioresistens]MCK4083817.1 hypothetical protein [Acinetobacter radioresistens]